MAAKTFEEILPIFERFTAHRAAELVLAPEMPATKTILVVAAVVIEGGRVLLTQRKAGAHLEGMWEFPGGKVRGGEDPRRALVRELREEVGIAVSVGEIVDVTFHRYEDANKAVLLLFFEAARTPESPPPRCIDVAAFEWAGADGLAPERFPPADVGVLRKVRARLDSAR